MRFFNTLTGSKDEFKEIDKGVAKIYSCGPTVYNYAHIGNWRSFVFSDILNHDRNPDHAPGDAIRKRQETSPFV